MIVHRDLEQGSDAWRRARAGVVTASGINGVLTPATLKPSKSTDYLEQIVAERLTGEPCDDFEGGVWTQRGTDMEAEARSWYEFDRGVVVDMVGFISTDDGRVGCSPDGIVGADGGIEIKCPSAKVFVRYAMDSSALVAQYRGQAQMFLYVTGRAWIDLVAYNPGFAPVVVRVTPDAEYQAALVPALAGFLLRVDEAVARLAPNVIVNPFA